MKITFSAKLANIARAADGMRSDPRHVGETERMPSDTDLRICEVQTYRSLWYPHYLLVAEIPAMLAND